MEDNGIGHAVVMGFPWVNEAFCSAENNFLLDSAEKSNGKIIPFGSISMKSKDVARDAAQLKKCGFAGIGEIAFYKSGMDADAIRYLREVFEAAAGLDYPVCLHVNEPVGHSYTGKYDPMLSELFCLIKDFPRLTLVLSHWGGGLVFYELMPKVSEVMKHVFYDTAASPFLYDERIYSIAADIIGPDRILFGSDYPLVKPERYIHPLQKNLPEKYYEKILWGNAHRLLHIQ